ncbi:MAG: ABC transporter substrate-binding protein [Pseudonocardia sp.]|nr:ABC transporter substrate-binding protein [Pseudonocardia sp.]
MKVHFGRSAGLLAAALSAVVLAAGCASGASGEAGGGDTRALGPEKAAAGEPVKIGWISTGQTQANDTTDEIRGAEAVVAYANARLGGIGGRPIELVTCEEKGTPAGAQACGNRMVSEGVSAVAAGSSGQADPWIEIANAAGIPVGMNFASTELVLDTPNVFVFGNPLGAHGTPAAFARENGAASAAMLVIDVPAASGPAKALAPGFFANAGAAAEVVAVPPGTADMTPQVQAAQARNPQMYHILGDETFCTSAIKAIRTLGIQAPITAIDRCVGPNGSASIPGGYENVEAIAQANTNPDDGEFKIYEAVVEEYGPDGLELNPNSASGYQGMLSLVRAVNASGTTDLTPKGVSAAIASAPAVAYPLGGGGTFQCNGTAVPAISKNICSKTSFLADITEDGTLTSFRTLDTTGIYEAPKS